MEREEGFYLNTHTIKEGGERTEGMKEQIQKERKRLIEKETDRQRERTRESKINTKKK